MAPCCECPVPIHSTCCFPEGGKCFLTPRSILKYIQNHLLDFVCSEMDMPSAKTQGTSLLESSNSIFESIIGDTTIKLHGWFQRFFAAASHTESEQHQAEKRNEIQFISKDAKTPTRSEASRLTQVGIVVSGQRRCKIFNLEDRVLTYEKTSKINTEFQLEADRAACVECRSIGV